MQAKCFPNLCAFGPDRLQVPLGLRDVPLQLHQRNLSQVKLISVMSDDLVDLLDCLVLILQGLHFIQELIGVDLLRRIEPKLLL